MKPGRWILALFVVVMAAASLPADNAFYVGAGDQDWTANDIDADWNDTSGGGGTDLAYPGTNAAETATFDQAGANNVTVSGALANPPAINVTNGAAVVTINLTAGGVGFTTITLAAGATLNLTGSGTVQITSITLGAGSTLSVGAGITLTVGNAATLNGATLSIAATGVVRFDNAVDFTGATLANSGTLRFDSTNQSNAVTTGGVALGAVDCVGAANTTSFTDAASCTSLTLGSAGTVTFSATLTVADNVTQTGAGTVNLDANSSLGNGSGDTVSISAGHLDGSGFAISVRNISVTGSGSYTAGDGSFITGTTASFATTGNITIGNVTFNSSAPTTLMPDAVDDFTGSITVSSGTTLVVAGNLTLPGAFTANNNNNLTVNDGVLLRVDGTFTFAGAGTLTVGTANPALDLRGATVTFNTATVTNNGTIVFDSSANGINVVNSAQLTGNIDTNGTANTVAFDADPGIATLDCNGGASVTFAAGLTTTGNVTRTGGGTTTITGAVSIGGSATMTGSGAINFNGGGTITGDVSATAGDINSGGTLTLNGANVTMTAGANLGNVTFSGGASTTLTISAADHITGSISVTTTTTVFVNGNITFAGTLTVAANCVLELEDNGTFTGVTVNNSGLIRFDSSGGNITVTAAASLGGVLGFIGGSGTTIFSTNPQTGSTLNITVGNTLRVTGASDFTNITFGNPVNGAVLEFQGTFNVTPRAGTMGQVHVSSGTVTFVTTALTTGDFNLQGTANATVNLGFTSSGAVTVSSSGTLTLSGAVAITGVLDNNTSGTIELDAGGTVGGLTTSNTAITNVDNVFLTVNGNVSAQDGSTIDATGLALDISGDVTISGTADFIAGNGTQLGGATVTFSSTGTVTVGNVTFDRPGTTALSYNAANLFTGTFTVNNGATVNAAGNLALTGVLTVGSGAAATLDITGTLTLSAATGTVAANGVLGVSGLLTLTGTALTVNGALNLAGNLTETGNANLLGTGTTNLSGATFDINIDGTGTFSITAVTVSAATTVAQHGDLLLLSNVTLNGNGTWGADAADTLGLAAAATSVSITVDTGSFGVDVFNAGNAAGATALFMVTGAGSVTVGTLTVPLTTTAATSNMLTLNETSTGTITVTGDVTVVSDDAGTAGDGGTIVITTGSSVTFQGDVNIGTTGGTGAATDADGCTLTLGDNATLTLGPNATTPTFAIGRHSVLRVIGTAGNEATILVSGATPYAMTLDGGIAVSFLDLSGYDASGLQLLANFGEAGIAAINFSCNNVNFMGGQVGGTHLTVGPDLATARGGVGAGQALFLELHFGNAITDTGFIVTAATPDTSSLKIGNTTDDYGIGFTITAIEAETTGVAGQIGGDNDGNNENINITWGSLALNNTVVVSNALNNPFGVALGLGNAQTLLIANFAVTGTDASVTISQITLTLTGGNIGTNIQNLTVSFDTDGDGVADSVFAAAQNPAGAGPITYTGDTQILATGQTFRMFVIGDVVAGVDVDFIQVEIVDASTDVAVDVFTGSSGSADSGVRAISSNSGVVFAGPGNPSTQNANAGDIKTALHFQVSTDIGSPIGLTITSIRISVQTNDTASNIAIDRIAGVTLWQGDGNAGLGAGDTLLETVDNGAVAAGWSETGSLVEINFDGLNFTVAPGAFQDFWVTIAFTAVAVGGVPTPNYTVFIDNSLGTALNNGGTSAFQGEVYGGSIALGTTIPGDDLEDLDTYHDEKDIEDRLFPDCTAGSKGRLPWALVLLALMFVAAAGRRVLSRR